MRDHGWKLASRFEARYHGDMKILILISALFVSIQAQAAFDYELRCSLRNQTTGKTLDSVEIGLGVHSLPAEASLYDDVTFASFAYIDVNPLGPSAGYKSELSIEIGELPEDSGRPTRIEKLVVDPFDATEAGVLVLETSLELPEGKFSASCSKFSEYYQD